MMLVVTRNETAATLEAPANVLSLSRHVPSLSGSATRSVAQNEARKRRASQRHVVGCCEELASRHSEERVRQRRFVGMATLFFRTLLDWPFGLLGSIWCC